MAKWILGILLALIAIVGGTCWYGYNKLTSGGDTARVSLAIPADRAWAYLSEPDSMAADYEAGTTVTSSGTGPLAVGDTLRIRTATTPGSTRETSWLVESIEAPRRIGYVTLGDSTTPQFRREDAIIPGPGDSIAITVRVMVPDLAAELSDSAGAVAERMMGSTGKLLTAAMRLMEQQRLDKLKARVEGRS